MVQRLSLKEVDLMTWVQILNETAFHIALINLGQVRLQLFSLQIWAGFKMVPLTVVRKNGSELNRKFNCIYLKTERIYIREFGKVIWGSFCDTCATKRKRKGKGKGKKVRGWKSAGAIEYTNWIPAEGYNPSLTSVVDMTLNNLMARFQPWRYREYGITLH